MPIFDITFRSEEHTSELQSHDNLVCRLLLEKKKTANWKPHALCSRCVPGGPPCSVWRGADPLRRGAGIGGRTPLLHGRVSGIVFFLMIRRPPRSTLFPTRRSSD